MTVSKKIILIPNRKWFSDDIRESKLTRSKAENTWRKTKLEVHRQLYQRDRTDTNNLISKAKREYISQEFAQNLKKPGQLYKLTNNILKRPNGSILPEGNPDDVCEQFQTFFSDKITKIRFELIVREPSEV
ncbi:hypothetical protein SNE40_009548 [Patella caerulea]|uniref:Uncharacterized protein n=1 Tax=Patella caerulea TaxID=87958 RepID=A0AAN8JYL5_PATCE